MPLVQCFIGNQGILDLITAADPSWMILFHLATPAATRDASLVKQSELTVTLTL